MPAAARQRQVVLGVTGSIACYRACDLVRQLRKEQGVEVHVVMTPEAARFVTPLTFQTLSGNRVWSDVFEAPEEWDLLHTSLSERADLVVVCPATLNLLGKLAHGICDDLLLCVLFATPAPVLLVPAMNPRMFHHPANRENMERLRRMGYEFVGPTKGKVACGQEGLGHIADTDAVVSAIRKKLALRGGRRGRMKDDVH
jgi:phosphopantothenoylcysteine decarboxylase/phosphopantothenate--cysteine ligase